MATYHQYHHQPYYQTFAPNFARLPQISRAVYDVMLNWDQSIREVLAPELLDYYVTALLWARLLDIKRRYRTTSLTALEHAYLKCFQKRGLALPEPLWHWIRMIGTITHTQANFQLYLCDHWLPVAYSIHKSGYHAPIIDSQTHNHFEEIPSLGVSGDCIMRLIQPMHGESIRGPNFPFLPPGTIPTSNLAGYFEKTQPMNEKVVIFLRLISISHTFFNETVPYTRLNMDLVEYVSAKVNQSKAYNMRKFCIDDMDASGAETQMIETHPHLFQTGTYKLSGEERQWTQLDVTPRGLVEFQRSSVALSYFTGFQLYKEAVAGSHANWCCVKLRESFSMPTGHVPECWIENRNARRIPFNAPPGAAKGITRNQQLATEITCGLFSLGANGIHGASPDEARWWVTGHTNPKIR